MTTPKIGVIGCGYWGKNLVRNFSNLNSLHSIYDTNKDHAHTMAATYNIKPIELVPMLESEIDGVVIAAPAHLHYELAKSALLANKHVFVEKPLSLEVKEAKQLCNWCREVYYCGPNHYQMHRGNSRCLPFKAKG